MRSKLLVTLAVFLCGCVAVNACTTFCLTNKNEVLFGRNYDWGISDALVFVNKRGVAKVATVGESPNPAKWISKFGSVTFNQYGRENPTGGMNEAGLVVEQMWLVETEYSNDGALPTLGSQEWIQYLLDTSATAEEAVRNAARVRILSDVKVHYLVSDKAGNTAAIEFVSGKMVVHIGESLREAALTNDTYEKSISYKRGTALEKANSAGSLDRFTRAAQKTALFPKLRKQNQEAVEYAFEILSNVENKGVTQWSIVYDLSRGRIYFRTLPSPQIKSIDMNGFDYSCGEPVKMFDMNAKIAGNVTVKFTDYTRKANRDLIERSFNGTDFLKDVPRMERFYMASYPESFACVTR